MSGFFTRKETESKTRPTGRNLSCTSCGLYRDARTPKFTPYGNFKKKIMLIGEMPSETDDRDGELHQDRTGRFLKRTMKELGIDVFEDCISINAINCYTDNEQSPLPFEVDCCRKIVMQHIEAFKPKVIIAFGMSAVVSLIGTRWKKDIGSIAKWRGWTIPDQTLSAWVCPVFSIKQVEFADEKKSTEKLIWKQDLEQAIKMVNKPFLKHIEPEIEIITDLSVISNIKAYHSDVMVAPMAAFDYECTGLKPHAEGHRIVCASIANTANHAWVFEMPRSKRERQPFIDFLANEKIRKIAQNMKYEEIWSTVRLKQPVQGWHWDTMLASHQLDNRQSVTGLKFQVYVQFGIIDYSSDIEPYLHGVEDKNANSHNRILELMSTEDGKKKVLLYCGYDSIYEYRLTHIQLPLILPKQPKIN